MQHPADELLLRIIHEPEWTDGDVRLHVAQCAACTERQRALRDDDALVASLLGTLDRAPPALAAGELMVAPRGQFRRRALLAAQITIFVAAAAAAMTIPASPFYLGKPAPASVASDSLPPTAPPDSLPQSDGVAPVGISLDAPASLVVELTHAQASGELDIHLVAGNQVIIRSLGGAVGYTVNEGRVVVDNRVAADRYELEIPFSLAKARVMTGNRVLFHKDGTQMGPGSSGDSTHFRLALRDGTTPRP